jgi:hypothetical protein
MVSRENAAPHPISRPAQARNISRHGITDRALTRVLAYPITFVSAELDLFTALVDLCGLASPALLALGKRLNSWRL